MKKDILTSGPVAGHLIRMTIPMIFGMLSMVLFNLIDTFFVARLGTVPLAAMGFTLPVVMFITGISLGLGVATASVVSRAIGSGDSGQVKRITSHSLLISLLSVFLFSLIGLMTIDTVFGALGADSTVLPFIKEYMKVWYLGVIFVVIPMVGNNAIRACGDTFYPGLIMVISTLLNMVLDPLLIFGWGPIPALGLSGAALATVISRSVAFVFALFILYSREKILSFSLPAPGELFDSAGKILYIAVPSSLANVLLPVGTAVITRFIARFGPEAVAAFGAAMRIEMFVFVLVMALSSALIPFIGQNWGRGNLLRIKEAVRLSSHFSFAWSTLNFFIMVFAARFLGDLFSRDGRVSAYITLYLLVLSVSYGMRSIALVTASAFNAVNRPLQASLLNLMRVFLFYIPFAYIGSLIAGLTGLFVGLSLANIAAGGVALSLSSRKLIFEV